MDNSFEMKELHFRIWTRLTKPQCWWWQT